MHSAALPHGAHFKTTSNGLLPLQHRLRITEVITSHHFNAAAALPSVAGQQAGKPKHRHFTLIASSSAAWNEGPIARQRPTASAPLHPGHAQSASKTAFKRWHKLGYGPAASSSNSAAHSRSAASSALPPAAGYELSATDDEASQAAGEAPSWEAPALVALDVEYIVLQPRSCSEKLFQVPGEVAVVGGSGEVIYHSYCHPGAQHLATNTIRGGVPRNKWGGAPSLQAVRDGVAAAVRGRTLVGHGLITDLKYLGLTHPEHLQVDTLSLHPFTRAGGQARTLKDLAQKYFGAAIQTGRHSAEEDAAMVLQLYRLLIEGKVEFMDATALEAHYLREIMTRSQSVLDGEAD